MKEIFLIRSQDSLIAEKVKPLYILNGIEAESIKFDSLKPSDIKAIHIKKEEEAKKIYGDKGKNGLILITTKWQ